MQLIRHLNDEELTDFLLESDERELRQSLRALAASLRSATDLPDGFWQGQRAAIGRQIATPPRVRLQPVLSWAAATGLIVLALVLLRSGPAPQQAQVFQDPDQELLVAVEQAVQSEVPSALEPAALLAEEINSSAAIQPRSTIHSRSRNHGCP